MASSGMLRRVALVRTGVSEEPSASIIRMTRIGELETTLAVSSNRWTPTVADRGVWRGQRGGTPPVLNLSFIDWSYYFSFKSLLIYPHKAESTTELTTQRISYRRGIEPRTSGLAARNSDHRGKSDTKCPFFRRIRSWDECSHQQQTPSFTRNHPDHRGLSRCAITAEFASSKLRGYRLKHCIWVINDKPRLPTQCGQIFGELWCMIDTRQSKFSWGIFGCGERGR
jgi:hypothetical protein